MSGHGEGSGRSAFRLLARASATPVRSALVLVGLPPLVFAGLIALAGLVLSALLPGLAGDERLLPAAAIAALLTQIAMLALLLAVLDRQGENLADIGWSGQVGPAFVLSQFAVAIITVLALTAFQRWAFEPGVAVLSGAAPVTEARFALEAMNRASYPVIAIMAFAPLVGDSVYRGYALPRLASRLGPAGAIAVSALFFGLLHAVLGVQAIVFAAGIGVILSVIFFTLARGRLWGLAIGHGIYNALLPIM